MKAIWTGSIGFGLVNIPVKMYSAVEVGSLDFDMLDKKDHANIKFKRINENSGKEVVWENIVKGFKIEDKYVILTDEDFEKASPAKSKIIEIAEFVDIAKVDSIYFDTPYYLEPDKSGTKAYALLRDALQKSNKAGLGNFVLRTKETLCLIKPFDNILLLNKLRYFKEIRPRDSITISAIKSKPAELKMAIELINQLTDEFDISKYKDTYSDELMKLIKAKSKGKKLASPKMKVVHSNAQDLMAQLKASIGNSRKAS